MATSDSATVTEDKSDMFSDETGDDIVERFRTFGFDVKTEKTDLTLLVGDEKIYVTRVALEMISPAFEDFFREELQDNERNEVRIHGTTFEDFVEFLACIYPRKMHEVTSTNVHKVLPLAFEYDVDFLKRRCESVLIDEMSKAGVDESSIVKCTSSATPFLSSVRQLGLDKIVKHRLKEIESSDEKLLLDTHGKVYVYEKMLTALRSEACKYRYLSAGRNCNGYMNLERFTDTKYKRLDLRLDFAKLKTVNYEVALWNRSCNIAVQEERRYNAINFTLDSFKDKNLPHFRVAFKVVVRNNNPQCPQGDFCRQICDLVNDKRLFDFDNSLFVSFPMKDLQDIKYRMNGVYKISVHILINNPECS